MTVSPFNATIRNKDILLVRFLSFVRSVSLSCFCAFIAGMLPASTVRAADTYVNPIISEGADPWIIQKDGYYYYMHTTRWDVRIRKAPQLTGSNGLANAVSVTVFTPPPPYNHSVWAPELHFLKGKWYIYYAADDGDNTNHRMFVAEADTADPMGSYTFKGKICDRANDYWAIDGTVLQKEDGSMFFIWSGWPGATNGQQSLYIAPMSNPWTISGRRIEIGTTHYLWEYPPEPWGTWLQEGPEVLKKNGKTFLVYAANASWTDDYCLGMMVNTNGNYTNAASWTKISTPVFKTYTNLTGSIYGPGHCTFTKSADGAEDFIIYHAAKYSGAGWDRDVRAQRFSWTADNTPNFDRPIPTSVPLPLPSGERAATIPVPSEPSSARNAPVSVGHSSDRANFPGKIEEVAKTSR